MDKLTIKLTKSMKFLIWSLIFMSWSITFMLWNSYLTWK